MRPALTLILASLLLLASINAASAVSQPPAYTDIKYGTWREMESDIPPAMRQPILEETEATSFLVCQQDTSGEPCFPQGDYRDDLLVSRNCTADGQQCLYAFSMANIVFCGSAGCDGVIYEKNGTDWKVICKEKLPDSPENWLKQDTAENGRWQYWGGDGIIHWNPGNQDPENQCWMEDFQDAYNISITPAPLEEGTKVANPIKVQIYGTAKAYAFRVTMLSDVARPYYNIEGDWEWDRQSLDEPLIGAFADLKETGPDGKKRILCTIQGKPDSFRLLENIENGRHMLMTNAGAVHWREDGTCWQNYTAKIVQEFG